VARLTVRETAAYVRLAAGTLNSWRSAGRGPRFIKLGRKILYDTVDLDQWINSHKQTSTSDHPQMRLRRRRYRAGMISQRRQRTGEIET
jgi:hypothetical protein